MTTHRTLVASAAAALWGAAALIAFTQAPSPGQTGAVPHGLDLSASKLLYGEKCSACHDLPVPQEKGYNRTQWTRTVNLMLTKYHASDSISRDQADRIVDYLATFAPAASAPTSLGDPWATDNDDVWSVPASRTRVINFESPDAIRALRQASSGDGSMRGVWRISAADLSGNGDVAIVSDPGANGGRFALLIDPVSSSRDIDIRVRFRIVRGKASPAVGIAFGLTTPDTYSLMRYDALRGEISLMRLDGARHATVQKTAVTSGKDVLNPGEASSRDTAVVPVAPIDHDWHTLRLLVHGMRVRGWFDMSKRVAIDLPDYNGGQVALWSQGDTTAEFDDWITDDYDTLPAAPAAAR